MAVLRFPGSAAVLARHAEALPQPDQLCGPFSVHVALHALLDRPPSVPALAVASGTRVFPSDVAEWRPPGAAFDTSGWGLVPHAPTAAESGSDALGVAAGVVASTGVEVVAARDLDVAGVRTVLTGLLDGPDVGVVANVRTGAIDPGTPFDVGHFLVVWGVSADGEQVGLADTYRELGEEGQPPGCRVVTAAALHAGLVDPPGRGLLLLVDPASADDVRHLVASSGGSTDLWAT